MTVPAAAINFRKSRRDTLPPIAGGVCAIPKEKESLIINKPLEIYSLIEKTHVWHLKPWPICKNRYGIFNTNFKKVFFLLILFGNLLKPRSAFQLGVF
jgi:hypothetical protein